MLTLDSQLFNAEDAAQFERAQILERQSQGIALAKAHGIYKRRKPSLAAGHVAELVERAERGVHKAVLAREFGVSRETVYA